MASTAWALMTNAVAANETAPKLKNARLLWVSSLEARTCTGAHLATPTPLLLLTATFPAKLLSSLTPCDRPAMVATALGVCNAPHKRKPRVESRDGMESAAATTGRGRRERIRAGVRGQPRNIWGPGGGGGIRWRS